MDFTTDRRSVVWSKWDLLTLGADERSQVREGPIDGHGPFALSGQPLALSEGHPKRLGSNCQGNVSFDQARMPR